MNVTVTISAAPELLAVLNRIADSFGVKKESLPAEPAPEKIKPKKEKAEPQKEQTPIATEIITREQVRAKAIPISKAGHREIIKKRLKEMGADNLDALAEEKFPEFMTFLNAF